MGIYGLARPEFASPRTVVGMNENIMIPNMKECAQIAVAQYYYTLYSKHDYQPIIIDGNNRITAITHVRFISTQDIPDHSRRETLRAYCREYGLEPIRFNDYFTVLQLL